MYHHMQDAEAKLKEARNEEIKLQGICHISEHINIINNNNKTTRLINYRGTG